MCSQQEMRLKNKLGTQRQESLNALLEFLFYIGKEATKNINTEDCTASLMGKKMGDERKDQNQEGQ